VSEYGVHILYYQGDVPAGPVALDEALKANLTAEIHDTKEKELLNKLLDDWKTAVGVETFEGYTLEN